MNQFCGFCSSSERSTKFLSRVLFFASSSQNQVVFISHQLNDPSVAFWREMESVWLVARRHDFINDFINDLATTAKLSQWANCINWSTPIHLTQWIELFERCSACLFFFLICFDFDLIFFRFRWRRCRPSEAAGSQSPPNWLFYCRSYCCYCCLFIHHWPFDSVSQFGRRFGAVQCSSY